MSPVSSGHSWSLSSGYNHLSSSPGTGSSLPYTISTVPSRPFWSVTCPVVMKHVPVWGVGGWTECNLVCPAPYLLTTYSHLLQHHQTDQVRPSPGLFVWSLSNCCWRLAMTSGSLSTIWRDAMIGRRGQMDMWCWARERGERAHVQRQSISHMKGSQDCTIDPPNVAGLNTNILNLMRFSLVSWCWWQPRQRKSHYNRRILCTITWNSGEMMNISELKLIVIQLSSVAGKNESI